MLGRSWWVGILVVCGLLVMGRPPQAADMNGAWARSADACAQVFVRRGNRIAFARDAHRYGMAFILENDRIRGRIATCRITWRTDDPKQFDAKCSATVFDSANFTLRVIDDNTINRVRPGAAEQETFVRCAL